MSEFQPIGNSGILVADDEFANAYQVGYLTYKLDDSTKTLTDMELYALFFGVMTGVGHSGRYSAGYLTGWVAGLLEGGTKPSATIATLVVTHTQEVQA